jgi:hypothetical protein
LKIKSKCGYKNPPVQSSLCFGGSWYSRIYKPQSDFTSTKEEIENKIQGIKDCNS